MKLIDYDLRPGVYTKVDSDDWPATYEKIVAAATAETAVI
jgi:hypothetical protein